jgi:hypothetical protein
LQIAASPFKKSEVDRVDRVIEAASAVIEEQGGAARAAAKALKALSDNMDRIQQAVAEPTGGKRSSASKRDAADAFMFTYEEESDPESFFVPYVWEVVVCVATASLMDWNKAGIRVFPLLEDPSLAGEHHPRSSSPGDGGDERLGGENPREPVLSDRIYSKDVSDVV